MPAQQAVGTGLAWPPAHRLCLTCPAVQAGSNAAGNLAAVKALVEQ